MEQKRCYVLSGRTIVAEKLMKYLRESFPSIESQQRNMDLTRESAVVRMAEIEFLRESLKEQLSDLEEKGFGECKQGKKRKLVSEENEVSLTREEFLIGVKRREEELDEQLVSVHKHIQRLEVAQAEVQGIRRLEHAKLKEIESKEQDIKSVREMLADREEKINLIIGTLDQRVSAVEKKEAEFKSFLEGKTRELALKENKLSMKKEEFTKEVELTDERFRKQEKLRHGFFERLEISEKKLEDTRAMIDERFKEIEFRENGARESVAVSVKEADLIRESMENKLEQFEKMKIEFNSTQEDKMRELVSKEQQLVVMSKELVKDAKLRDEQLIKREKLGHKLLKRLELARDDVENLKKMVDERFKELGLKEINLNSTDDWVEEKLEEADLKEIELTEREKIIRKKEGNVKSEKNELLLMKKKLDLKEKDLKSWEKVLEVKQGEVDLVQKLNEQRLKELDRREKNLNSVRDFTRTCFKEHLTIKNELNLERNLVERRGMDLELKRQQLEFMEKELELKEKQMRNHVNELELKQQGSTDVLSAHVKTHTDESVDLKFIVRMDGKILQMFLNDPEKDLDSMGDEIFKVLHLSSDPAKLVLDAMVGFHPPHLREEDTEFNVRRTCIILLEQLIKMSRRIQPHVREEAVELASSWKAKMKATAEDQLEVLGFLHLLAAYNLASYFQEDEISSFLMMVAKHRQTPELRRILGFTGEHYGLGHV